MLRQRYPLYEAELEATQPWRWLGGRDAADAWIKTRMRTKFWRTHCPNIRHHILTYPAPGKMSGGLDDKGVLLIGVLPESLMVPTLIHELTHPLVGVTKGTTPADHERDHGKRFAGALIEAYRHFDCAKTAEDLIKAFDRHHVRWESFE